MRVQLTETVLRDANQSLIATRLPYSVYEPILSTMDKAGYYSIECWGGATFDTCLRFLNEDPWERLRALRKEISTELEIAPYMVFSDKALRGLCRLRPQTRDELIQVNGIGEKKADAFGEQFMVAIEEFESEHARDGA